MLAEVPGRGKGQRYTARGSEMIFKALAASSGGDLSLMERTLPPGGRQPPPHRHTNCSEAYFGLDGLVTVTSEWIMVSMKGRLLIRNVCMVFDRYLAARANGARFSQTV